MPKPTKHDYIAILINILVFLGCIFALTRCTSLPPALPPVYRGAAQELPARGTHLLVYYQKDTYFRNNEIVPAEQEAIMWLQSRGYTVIERRGIDVALREQGFTMQMGNDAAVLRAGKLLGAKQIVFVSNDYTRVSLRSIDSETGRILWSGTGSVDDIQSIIRGSQEVVPTLIRGTLDYLWSERGKVNPN